MIATIHVGRQENSVCNTEDWGNCNWPFLTCKQCCRALIGWALTDFEGSVRGSELVVLPEGDPPSSFNPISKNSLSNCIGLWN